MGRPLPVLVCLLVGCGAYRQQDPVLQTPEARCAEMLPSQCDEDADCAVIEADAVVDDGFGGCTDRTGNPVRVGCHARGQECLMAETWAGPPPDDTGAPEECWAFPDSCIPEGWVPCAEPSYPEC